ncbi:HAD hydrolase family protein [Paenibacillus glucanolyticus]|uniref:HAD hydrolase family protein n=1 Tax=Paenibacillus glucanolyticus TaxID=59843 RepID=UPI00096F8373|nr:HAD hydrolase family protein [Paenibacillus glucanolyticus]OMF81581.1 hypothetical protein BK142_03645 [Paenibacillus glucanolyticus]
MVTINNLITDLDDTLSESCKPLFEDTVVSLLTWLEVKKNLAIVTMQNIKEVIHNVCLPLVKGMLEMNLNRVYYLYCFTSGGCFGYRIKITSNVILEVKKIYGDYTSLLISRIVDLKSEIENVFKVNGIKYIIRERYPLISVGIPLENFNFSLDLQSIFDKYSELQVYSKRPNLTSFHILPKNLNKGTAVNYIFNILMWEQSKTVILGDDFSDNGMDLDMITTLCHHISTKDDLGKKGLKKFGEVNFVCTTENGPLIGTNIINKLLGYNMKDKFNAYSETVNSAPIIFRNNFPIRSKERTIKSTPLQHVISAIHLVKVISKSKLPPILCPILSGGSRLVETASILLDKLNIKHTIGPGLKVDRQFGMCEENDKKFIVSWLEKFNFITQALTYEQILLIQQNIKEAQWVDNSDLLEMKKKIDQVFFDYIWKYIFTNETFIRDQIIKEIRAVDYHYRHIYMKELDLYNYFFSIIYEVERVEISSSELAIMIDECRYKLYAIILNHIGWKTPILNKPKNLFVNSMPTIIFVDDSISFGRIGFCIQTIRNVFSSNSIYFYSDNAAISKWNDSEGNSIVPDYWYTQDERLIEDVPWINYELEIKKAPSQLDIHDTYTKYKEVLVDWKSILDSDKSGLTSNLGLCTPADAMALVSLSCRAEEDRVRFIQHCYSTDLIRAGLGRIDYIRADMWLKNAAVNFSNINKHIVELTERHSIKEILNTEDQMIQYLQGQQMESFKRATRNFIDRMMLNEEIYNSIKVYLSKEVPLKKGAVPKYWFPDSTNELLFLAEISYTIARGHPLWNKKQKFAEGEC